MTITAIEIKKVKGIEYKQFNLQLMPNKPNLLVAPNGFGKSSIATAFASMNSKGMTLADRDCHKEDPSHQPELSITVNSQKLTANCNKNEIRQQFDVIVIRSGLIPKAKRTYQGGVSPSLEIQPISICKIPEKTDFLYHPSKLKSTFGTNGKILPNIANLLQNSVLCEVVSDCDFSKMSGKRIQQDVTTIIKSINQQVGTADQINQWIENNVLNDLRAINSLHALAGNLRRFSLVTSETEAFLAAYQITEVYKADSKSFDAAIKWLKYTAEKKSYDELLTSFCSSDWQWAKLNEDKKSKTLSVIFPQAHQLSNGQRDVVTLVVKMRKAMYEGSKKPLILVIDEVFDYLDDANLVVFQYYVTSLIEEHKQRGQKIYLLILTHLDPEFFFHFCFNNHKIHTHYLQTQATSGKSKETLKLVEIRECKDIKENIKDDLNKYWFHYYPEQCEITSDEWPERLNSKWRKSDDFHTYIRGELACYLQNKSHDPLAICFAVRIMIEKNTHDQLCDKGQKEEFLATRKTREKLEYAAKLIFDIPEIYFLLGLIYNTNLHWQQGKDYVSPLAAKLAHPTIKKMISEIGKSLTAKESDDSSN